jgi:hypothetical protein
MRSQWRPYGRSRAIVQSNVAVLSDKSLEAIQHVRTDRDRFPALSQIAIATEFGPEKQLGEI